MAEENLLKIKLLKIMEILRQETDEDHPMTKVELAARLVAMNVSCSPPVNDPGHKAAERAGL